MIQGIAPRRRLAALLAVPLAGALLLRFRPCSRGRRPPRIPLAPAPVPEGWRPRPVRAGTVSLYGAAMYGTLLGSGPFGETFNHGVGLGFALRYRNSAESSLGLGFESHQFDGKSDADRRRPR